MRLKKGFTLIELMLALTILLLAFVIIGAAMNSGLRSWRTGRDVWEKNIRRYNTCDILQREIASMLYCETTPNSAGTDVPIFLGDSRSAGKNAVLALECGENKFGFVAAGGYLGGAGVPEWVEVYIDTEMRSPQTGLVMRRIPLGQYLAGDKEGGRIIELDPDVSGLDFEYVFRKPDEETERIVEMQDLSLKWPRHVRVKIQYSDGEKYSAEIPVMTDLVFFSGAEE